MNMTPESYYALPRNWRFFLSVVAAFLMFAMWADPAPIKPLALVIIVFMTFCFLTLQLSKVWVEKDRIILTWAPWKIVLHWKDVQSLNIGRELQSPSRLSMYVTKQNGKKVHLPIHGMSESNVKILKEAFGVAKRDF
jgi:hypothetical protein